MQIKNKRDIEALDAKLKNELGIDISEYKNEEVVENFVELLLFPKYVINWGIRPILLSFLAFIAGFAFLNLVHVEYVIYTVVGLVLFLLTGGLIGLLFLFWKIKKDIWGVIDYSLNITKSVVEDLNIVKGKMNEDNQKDLLLLVFKGIIHLLTIPLISRVISEKIPLIGRVLTKFINKLLTALSNKIKFEEVKLSEALKEDENETKVLNKYIQAITNTSNGLEHVMVSTFRLTQLPFKVLLIFTLSVLCSFIYLIH
ncbi:conserved membrane hypothetical protein [Tenacibaculum sp. 190524A02b]|uniref:Uncharacterized protein n=1 Tax=Tenacibaculum vairaonense TaxID=3137860 RepID=A0ABM9PI38_9FLAO